MTNPFSKLEKIMLIIRTFRKIVSTLKCIVYKHEYKNYMQSRKMTLGYNTHIYILGSTSKITLEDNFTCRNNINIRVSGGELVIGKNVFFNDNCGITCRSKIIIGSDCLIGQNVYIYDHDHEYKSDDLVINQGFKHSSVHIGNNVWIGSSTVILKGTYIGDNVVIAAGSIIQGNIPDNHLVYNKRQSNLIHLNTIKK
jgi:acetyltransferase-like isoleucine patch superfamily enzyme